MPRWTRTGALLLALWLAAAALAGAEVVQRGDLRVAFDGGIRPRALPRRRAAPVEVGFSAHVRTTDGTAPPQLRRIELAINRNGHLDSKGLPTCGYRQLQPATTAQALAACRRALVGTGSFRAKVVLPEQAPFPSSGRVTAFNGRLRGHPVVFAHVYGSRPLPQSQVLVFHLGRTRGGYRTTLSARLPRVAAQWGYVSSVTLALGRRFAYRGRRRSYISASCPAPAASRVAVFPLARGSFAFGDGRVLTATLIRSCRVLNR